MPLRRRGAVVLLSCYELGHQPHGLALAMGFLERAGFAPVAQDLACERLDEALIAGADFVGISVPMHTALRLGAQAGQRVRELNPGCHLCFYGLYAPLNADYLRACGADSVIGGEYEQALVDLVTGSTGAPAVTLERLAFAVPARRALPVLDRYAKLAIGGEQRLAGYTEASRGCKHGCRHCPIPAVYDRRFFVVDAEAVLADIAQHVAAGARHITFGDPDFFNGPRHAERIVRALHERWPALTYDVTIKVSHLLERRALLPVLAETGCAFIVSAVESLSDAVLARLDKGHTRADVERALALCREAGLVLRPTFVPFTPWTSLDDLVELADFIAERDLIDCVDPIQLSIRLLVPPGSWLLHEPAFGALDPAALTHRWAHDDPRVDALQRALAARCEQAAADDDELPAQTFAALRALIYAAAGREPAPPSMPPHRPPAPRLTEAWFC